MVNPIGPKFDNPFQKNNLKPEGQNGADGAQATEKPKHDKNILTQFGHLIAGSAQNAEVKAAKMEANLAKIAEEEGLPLELVQMAAAMTPGSENLIDPKGGKSLIV